MSCAAEEQAEYLMQELQVIKPIEGSEAEDRGGGRKKDISYLTTGHTNVFVVGRLLALLSAAFLLVSYTC